MAYINSPLDDEELKQGGSAGGAYLTGSGGGDPGGPTGAASGPKQSGTNNWVNLSTYLDANKGSGGQLADQIVGNAQGKVDTAGTAITNYQTLAQKQAAAGTKNYDSGLGDKIISDPYNVDKNAYFTATGGYTGESDPTRFKGYNEASSTYNKAKDVYDNINRPGTQKKTLTDVFQGRTRTDPYDAGNYTSGMANLDTFLVGADSDSAAPKFSGFKTKNADFGNKLSGAESTVGGYVTGAKNTSDATAKALKGKVTQSRADIYKWIDDGLEGRTKDLIAKAPGADQYEQLKSQYGDTVLSRLSKDNPQNYYSGHATRANVMSADERRKLEALSELDGGERPVEDAGNPFAFDADRFKKDLADEKNKLDGEAKDNGGGNNSDNYVDSQGNVVNSKTHQIVNNTLTPGGANNSIRNLVNTFADASGRSVTDPGGIHNPAAPAIAPQLTGGAKAVNNTVADAADYYLDRTGVNKVANKVTKKIFGR